MRRTPNRFHWYCSERSGACLGYCMVLLAGASANADRTYNLSAALERYSPGENHDTSGIRDMDSKKLATGLGVFRQILCCDVESARRVCFVNRNIYAADPGAVHPHVCNEICAFVHNRNVHGLPNFRGLFLRGRNYPSSVVEGDHRVYCEAYCTSVKRGGSQGAETELNQIDGGGALESGCRIGKTSGPELGTGGRVTRHSETALMVGKRPFQKMTRLLPSCGKQGRRGDGGEGGWEPYSARSVRFGSTVAARRAGIAVASRPTARRTTGTLMNVTGSVALTP